MSVIHVCLLLNIEHFIEHNIISVSKLCLLYYNHFNDLNF